LLALRKRKQVLPPTASASSEKANDEKASSDARANNEAKVSNESKPAATDALGHANAPI
jgi:hypothetical protein